MVKVQTIKRKNDTEVFVLYIPGAVARAANLQKGEHMNLTYDASTKQIVLSKIFTESATPVEEVAL